MGGNPINLIQHAQGYNNMIPKQENDEIKETATQLLHDKDAAIRQEITRRIWEYIKFIGYDPYTGSRARNSELTWEFVANKAVNTIRFDAGFEQNFSWTTVGFEIPITVLDSFKIRIAVPKEGL